MISYIIYNTSLITIGRAKATSAEDLTSESILSVIVGPWGLPTVFKARTGEGRSGFSLLRLSDGNHYDCCEGSCKAGQHMFSRVGMAGFTLPFGSAVYLEEEGITK